MDLLSPSFGLIFWMAVIFLLTLLILRKFAWRPILKLLSEREQGIADSLETAERVKAEMAQMKYEHEEILKEAKTERSQILKEAKEAKDQMINEAKEQAKVEAKKIIDDARVAINNQKMAALTDVKNQVGNLAVEVAEKILRNQLSEEKAQQDYVKKLIDEIELN